MTGAPRSARSLLAAHGLKPKKSWGQNFLHDPRTIERIADAAEVGAEDTVVEIGAGLGALTSALAARAGRVIAVERDPDLVAVLRAELGSEARITIAAEDALATDLGALARAAGRPLVVVGNLPYQITTPLLFRILRAAGAGQVARAVLMVQKEVAERIVAGPGPKQYGRLSVMVQQAADVRVLFHVGPGAFLPPPQVTSTVFRLAPRAMPLAAVVDPKWFAAVVRAAFGGRRKMLRRALEPIAGAAVGEVLSAAGVAGTRRAEELSVVEFAAIANALAQRGGRIGDPDADDDHAGEGG